LPPYSCAIWCKLWGAVLKPRPLGVDSLHRFIFMCDKASDLKTIRVLMVTNMYPGSGDPTYGCFVKEQIDSLKAECIDSEVLFIDGCNGKLNYIKAIWSIRRSCFRSQFDLIHAHYGLSAIPARCQLQLPLIVSFCGDDLLGSPKNDGSKTIMSRFICWLSRIIARVSNACIVKSKEMLRVIPKGCQSYVVPNGVDFELFKPIDQSRAREDLNLDQGKKYLLFASNPALTVKRFQLAKESWERVRRIIPECELLTVYGRSRQEIALYLNAVDCLLVTSFHEGSPNIVKEAMACNLPIVSVAVGDVREILDHSHNCRIAEANSDDIAEKVTEVLKGNGRSNGRSRIGHLEMKIIAKRIRHTYERLLSEN